jgi:ribosomal protein S18 acetylase RimI-like enzyme
MSTIVPLTADDKADTVDIWFESFFDYPAMRQYFVGHAKNEQEYRCWLKVFLGLLFDEPLYLNFPLLGVRNKNGYLLAAMACYGTDLEKERPRALEKSYADFADALGEEGVRRLNLYEEINARQHPPEPHYWVDIVGVKKDHQGNGHARRLLEEIQSISASDPKSRGVFLDTEAFENVGLYQHLGYELIGESDTEGLHGWHLFRPDDDQTCG